MLVRRIVSRPRSLNQTITIGSLRYNTTTTQPVRPRSRDLLSKPRRRQPLNTSNSIPKNPATITPVSASLDDDEPDAYEQDPFTSAPNFPPTPPLTKMTKTELHTYLSDSRTLAEEAEEETKVDEGIDKELAPLNLNLPKESRTQAAEDVVASLNVQAAAIGFLVNKPTFLDIPDTPEEILLKAWFMLFQLNALVGRDYDNQADGQADYERFLTATDPHPVSDLTEHRILALKLAHCVAFLLSHFDENSEIWWSELPEIVFGKDAVERAGVIGAPPVILPELPSPPESQPIAALPSPPTSPQSLSLRLERRKYLRSPRALVASTPGYLDPDFVSRDLKMDLEDHQRTLDITSVAARLFSEKWERWTEILIFQSRRLPELQEMLDDLDSQFNLDEEEQESIVEVRDQLLKPFERKWRGIEGNGSGKALLKDALELAELLEESGWGQEAWEEAARTGLIKQNKPPELTEWEEKEKERQRRAEVKQQIDQKAVEWNGVRV
ncbi:hypothetical protein DL96DRAFT_537615 [Flagelloscypha sp. PMI_526]|nr:hypothetical protein DL96DRAFT_537615 [Flagelloscypha sp. PMI_526]